MGNIYPLEGFAANVISNTKCTEALLNVCFCTAMSARCDFVKKKKRSRDHALVKMPNKKNKRPTSTVIFYTTAY